MLPKFAAVAALTLMAGCAAKQKPISLEYVYRPRDQMLIPPGSQIPSRQRIEVKLGKARLGRRRGNACEVKTDTLQLGWNKSAAKLNMDVGGTNDPTRVPLASQEDINTFRQGLVDLESNGCLKPGESGLLLTRILEGVAMPARLSYSLRYGNIYQGFIDVRPPLRLKVVVPLREGPVVGFETAWYQVDNGRLKPERVESSRKGVVAALAKPNLAVVAVPAGTRFYRVFFLTRRSPNDHDILLLTAKTLEELDSQTARIRADSEASCKANPSCILVPQGSAISAEAPVLARGHRSYAPVAGTISDVMRSAGVKQFKDAKNIRVTRPYGKTLIPLTWTGAQTDILGLVLIGGESIHWED
ncbi:MAG: hypothetical protein HY820_09515 [Acidobacteria bacterium]|nr:hypothetical protein [Acidobacteriota bacterium]